MTHLCECQTILPTATADVEALAVHVRSPRVARQFQLLMQAHGLAHAQTLTFPLADLPSLELLMGEFPESDGQELRAVPVTADGPQMWEQQSLAVWTRRLTTSWFAQASQNLVFQGQPIVRSSDGSILGYEALVRARGPEGTPLIGAGALLEAASAHGQTRTFDALARITAIEQLYPQLAPEHLLFINFAPGVVYNPDICLQTTFRACQDVGADLSRLVFEVTEGEAFPDLRLFRSILDRYRAEGARVALDDLGSGHTSLSYLTELRPDIVKLDRSLIQGLHTSGPTARLVQSLVTYAHDLGIEVVAEGIEQREELEAVQAAGVDFVQGYYLARPAAPLPTLTPDALSQWILAI